MVAGTLAPEDSAPLHLSLTIADATPVTLSATTANSDGGGVTAHIALPAGLTVGTAMPSVGTYNQATGDWTIGSLGLAVAALHVQAVAHPQRAAGGPRQRQQRRVGHDGRDRVRAAMSFAGRARLATMTTPTHPGRMLFVSLPVADVERSKAFFTSLGFSFNPLFSDDNGACMLVGEQAYVMLLSHEKFAEFSKLPTADPTTHALALYCFSVPSRDEVDSVTEAALAAGAVDHDDADDQGYMYSRSFFDLDGHGWQVMWMDPAAAQQEPEAVAADAPAA
jgi:hypothetical protein